MIREILEKHFRKLLRKSLKFDDVDLSEIGKSAKVEQAIGRMKLDKLEKELTEYKWQLTRQEIKEEYMNDTVLKYRGNGLWEEVRKDDGWIKEHKEWIKRKEDEIRQN